ncbi:hypothetical protein K0M31_004728, partial [Melipona bicolor]
TRTTLSETLGPRRKKAKKIQRQKWKDAKEEKKGLAQVARSRWSIRDTLFRSAAVPGLSGNAQSRRFADELPVIACIREEPSRGRASTEARRRTEVAWTRRTEGLNAVVRERNGRGTRTKEKRR